MNRDRTRRSSIRPEPRPARGDLPNPGRSSANTRPSPDEAGGHLDPVQMRAAEPVNQDERRLTGPSHARYRTGPSRSIVASSGSSRTMNGSLPVTGCPARRNIPQVGGVPEPQERSIWGRRSGSRGAPLSLKRCGSAGFVTRPPCPLSFTNATLAPYHMDERLPRRLFLRACHRRRHPEEPEFPRTGHAACCGRLASRRRVIRSARTSASPRDGRRRRSSPLPGGGGS